MLRDPNYLVLRDEKGDNVPLQTRILHRWPDGSVRWLLVDWQATVKGDNKYQLEISDALRQSASAEGGIRIQESNGTVTIDTGPAEFHLAVGGYGDFNHRSMKLRSVEETKEMDSGFGIQDESGRWHVPVIANLRLEDSGPLRGRVAIQADFGRLRLYGQHDLTHPLGYFEALLDFFYASSTVAYRLTVGNPGKAHHPGGFWQLGRKNSILITSGSFTIYVPRGGQYRWSPEPGQPFEKCNYLELFQTSSGGCNWQSSNHANRQNIVPAQFAGYRSNCDGNKKEGKRATPIVTFHHNGFHRSIAMRCFWENFPKFIAGEIDASDKRLVLGLFPWQFRDLHELQGGEQKTHEFVVAFGKDQVTPETPLEWVRSPLRVRVDPAWYAASGAVPYLMPEADDPNADYIKLVRAAIEGEDTFEKKREVVDEYGWRNFGDIYADHEAVFYKGAQPLVSHYNNQYDPLAGFAIQFMRSGDWRWWDAMNELAVHVVDIDIYHTDQDKSAYNHGLFWHTVHYTDAGLSTHRSYPRVGDGPRSVPATLGGGPGNEHNYTTGLMLHYFLTGNPQSREAAIGLAQWVIDMDDGSKTIFRWLDRGYTGLASATVSPEYHGPGRGAGNSINALLDGHRLTGDQKFLDKAEQLIRRSIHPADDIAARNLHDAERRWSYTVFLQALGKYLDYQAEHDDLDWMYAYGRAALLHYARWMAENEYPFLEKPVLLEYPTETWVAQDMRKSEVFKFAAKHAAGEERARFLERSEFFFRYVTTTLMGMKTRTLARPVVIMLSNGFMHAYFQKHPDVAAPLPRVNPPDFGEPEIFVPQKVRAKRRFAILSAVLATIGLLAFLWRVL